MRKFLQDGQGWTDEKFQHINWDNFDTVITKIFKLLKTNFSQYTKFMIDLANTDEQNSAKTNTKITTYSFLSNLTENK